MADTGFQMRSMGKKNKKGLALTASAPAPAPPEAQVPRLSGSDRDGILRTGIGPDVKLEPEDLEVVKELGAGNGGTVSLVRHKLQDIIMARKIIYKSADPDLHKRIVKELQIMHECNSPYIVSFYGACLSGSNLVICMEYMDVGSLDFISKQFGPIRVDILGKIAEALLEGLTYLYVSHKIMHRDVKPANILLNSKGQIKISDFGVSSAMEGSVANTFVGTGIYMAPERITGGTYTVKSDVWSVGMTLMELAIGKSPFKLVPEEMGLVAEPGADGLAAEEEDNTDGPEGILDLLQRIVNSPPPRLPASDAFPQILHDMINKCMTQEPAQRPTPKQLVETDLFIKAAKRTPVDLQGWATSLMHEIEAISRSQSTNKDPSYDTRTNGTSYGPSTSREQTLAAADGVELSMRGLAIRDLQRPHFERQPSGPYSALPP